MATAPVITAHARRRMEEYGVTEEDVRAAVAAGTTLHLDRHGNPVRAAVVGGRLVVVVVAAGSVPPRVITVIDRGGV